MIEIDGRGEHDNIRIDHLPDNLNGIVLLDAYACVALTGVAAKAALDILAAQPCLLHFVA